MKKTLLILLFLLTSCKEYVYVIRPVELKVPDQTQERIKTIENELLQIEAADKNAFIRTDAEIKIKTVYFDLFIMKVKYLQKQIDELEIIINENNSRARAEVKNGL